MSDQPANNDLDESELVSRFYECPKCKVAHNIKLPKSLAENRQRYPFPYAYLHSSPGKLKDLLTILYLDKELQIRGSEIVESDQSDIFSEELTKEIMDKLTERINSLEEENVQLKDLLATVDIKAMSKSKARSCLSASIIDAKPPLEAFEEEPSFEIEQEEKDSDLIEPLEIEAKKVDNVAEIDEFVSETLVDSDIEDDIEENVDEEIDKLFDLGKEAKESSSVRPTEKTPSNMKVKTPSEIKSKTPSKQKEPERGKINVFIVSTIGPGERKQKMTIDKSNLVGVVKETIGNIYGLVPETFHLAHSGITLDENCRFKEYEILDGDDILLIPSSTAGF